MLRARANPEEGAICLLLKFEWLNGVALAALGSRVTLNNTVAHWNNRREVRVYSEDTVGGIDMKIRVECHGGGVRREGLQDSFLQRPFAQYQIGHHI